jgi:hypothetical protein
VDPDQPVVGWSSANLTSSYGVTCLELGDVDLWPTPAEGVVVAHCQCDESGPDCWCGTPVYADREQVEQEALEWDEQAVAEVEIWGVVDSGAEDEVEGDEPTEARGQYAQLRALYLDSSIEGFEELRAKLHESYEVPVHAWQTRRKPQDAAELAREERQWERRQNTIFYLSALVIISSALLLVALRAAELFG